MKHNYGKVVFAVLLVLLTQLASALEWGYYQNEEPIFLGEFEGEEYLALPGDTEFLRYVPDTEIVDGLLNLNLVARGDDGDRALGRVGVEFRGRADLVDIEGTLNPDTGRIYLFGGMYNRHSLWSLELPDGEPEKLLSNLSRMTTVEWETTELRVFSEYLPCEPEDYGFPAYWVMPKVSDGSPPGGISQGCYDRRLCFDPLTGDIEPLWSIEASSYLTDDPADCSPASAIDGDIGTAWVEGVDGPGIGESLTLNFGIPTEVWNIGLLPGYFASPELLAANNRIKEVQITLSDGTSLTKEFEDSTITMVTRLRSFADDPHVVEWVRLTILEVYPGARWDDTAISELTVNYFEGY